jgi:hypothetical protein
MNRPIRLGTALAYGLAAVVISNTCMWVGGTVYFSSKIDEAFTGLCDILVLSDEPLPHPPTGGPAQPSPKTDYGRALAEYNKKVAERQQRGLAAINRAVERYHCK